MNPYVAQISFTFINILTWSIIARALMSWLPIDQGSGIAQALTRVTDPIIEPFRRILPQNAMMDLSPLFAIFALLFMSQVLAQLAALG